jgi:hypothetical protein
MRESLNQQEEGWPLRKEMNQREFQSLSDDALTAACSETIIEAYKETGRLGGDFQSEVFGQLSRGQQALFLHRVYHNHAAKSADDFYWWTVYFLPQTNLWAGIKDAFHYFGDEKAARLLEEIERGVRAKVPPEALSHSEESVNGLYANADLQPIFFEAYTRFQQLIPATLRLIAAHIRSHAAQFADISP